MQGRPGETITLDLVLARGDARLGGRVFDAAGAPIAGALVRVAPPGAAGYVPTTDGTIVRAFAGHVARTAADGTFACNGLPPGRLLAAVRAPGHGVATSELVVPQGTTGDVTVRLQAAGTVAGTIMRENGEPVVHAMVRAGADWQDLALCRDVTGEDGTFVLRGVTPGRVPMAVFVDGALAHEAELAVAEGGTARFDVRLTTPAAIVGRLVDASHRPLVGWRLSARSGERWVAHARAGDDGRFRLLGVTHAAHRLYAAAPPDVERAIAHGELTVLQRDDVWPGAEELLLVVPEAAMPTCRVHGRALGPGDEVLPQTRVTIGHMKGMGTLTVGVDPSTGTFTAGGLPPGPYWISAAAAGHAPATAGHRDLVATQDLDLGVLHMVAGGRIRGELLLPAGIEGERIEVQVLDARQQRADVPRRTGSTFESAVLGPGEYRVLVSGAGIAPAVVSCTVAAGEETRVIVRTNAGARCRVVAHSAPGAPEPQWVYGNVVQDGRLLVGRTFARQADGTWAADLWLGPGTWPLWLGSDNGLAGNCEFVVAATLTEPPPVRVVLRPQPSKR